MDEWDKVPVSHEQAREAVMALVDEHFTNTATGRRTQFSIPARRDDTDLVLCRYIKQQSSSPVPKLVEALRKLNDAVCELEGTPIEYPIALRLSAAHKEAEAVLSDYDSHSLAARNEKGKV